MKTLYSFVAKYKLTYINLKKKQYRKPIYYHFGNGRQCTVRTVQRRIHEDVVEDAVQRHRKTAMEDNTASGMDVLVAQPIYRVALLLL